MFSRFKIRLIRSDTPYGTLIIRLRGQGERTADPIRVPLIIASFCVDAAPNVIRMEFIEFSSCEERRLNQFETADGIFIGSAVLCAWLSRE